MKTLYYACLLYTSISIVLIRYNKSWRKFPSSTIWRISALVAHIKRTSAFAALLGDGFMVKSGDYPALKWETPTAVSYTHLDVYKRQRQGLQLPCGELLRGNFMQQILKPPEGTQKSADKPLSLIHILNARSERTVLPWSLRISGCQMRKQTMW